MKQEAFGTRLLRVTAVLIRESPRRGPAGALQPNVALSGDQLADYILSYRLKLLYTYLGSELARANAALYLLASIADRGAKFIAQMVKRVDFELPAFHKLARAPRYATAARDCSSLLDSD